MSMLLWNRMNFPFLMGDGTTLYYASDGEGTLGGYDIFVTRYDSEDNTYLRPSNIGMPFNSNANDYLYAVDELNNLGWFVTDRNQPTDTVCVYVFVPNESKQTYNYEATDPQIIKDAATLHSIQTTWTDEEQVRDARQRLAALKYGGKEEVKKADFHFIIDDSATYSHWSDFRSKEAQNVYRQLIQKEKDLKPSNINTPCYPLPIVTRARRLSAYAVWALSMRASAEGNSPWLTRRTCWRHHACGARQPKQWKRITLM